MTTQERQEISLLLELVRAHEDDNDQAHRRICQKIEELKLTIAAHCQEQAGQLSTLKDELERRIVQAEKQAVMEAPGKVTQGVQRLTITLRNSAAYIALFLSLIISILIILEKWPG